MKLAAAVRSGERSSDQPWDGGGHQRLLHERQNPLDLRKEYGRGVLEGKAVLVEPGRGPFELDRLFECVGR